MCKKWLISDQIVRSAGIVFTFLQRQTFLGAAPLLLQQEKHFSKGIGGGF